MTSPEGSPVVTSEREITCEDFARLLDGFLDGELDASSLRALALHATHCRSCAEELDHAEKLSTAIVGAVEDEAARVDTSGLWAAVSAKLETVPAPSRIERLREYVRTTRWASPIPVLAAGAVAAILVALSLWPTAEMVASEPVADNHAQIERIASSAPHVAVWSEPSAHTTAIWVASYEEPQ